jgi:hypothetical protein
MLHVCCIRAGEAFSPAYVLNLKDMVIRNLEGGLEGCFVCFTDRPEELPEHIETAPLPADLPGWWSKLALFREGLFPKGDRVLFFDLDTVITGSIDHLAAWDGEGLAILRDFYRPNGLQSSVMAWRAGEHGEIWQSFDQGGRPTHDPGGDQRWIEQNLSASKVVLWQDIFPKTFVSYKQSNGSLSEAPVVIFHGKPRPHEILDGWVPQVWKIDGLSSSALKAVCNTEQEKLVANVRSACARDLTWFDADNEEHDRHVAIIGGGPSVRDMIDEIVWRKSQGQDVWVLNNAAQALEGKIYVDAQVLLDARPETASFVTDANEHLVASQCDPAVFDAVERRNVTLWHPNLPWMSDLLKDERARVTYTIGGGTTVGMNALQLAVSRGYRMIHLYGFDSSYRGDDHHAYPQSLNDAQRVTEVLYNGKSYKCSPWMVGQAQEFMELYPAYAADGVTITVHGSGLLPDIANDLRNAVTPAQLRAMEILARTKPGAKGAEIGVFAADLSRELLKADPELELILVDSWEGDGKAYAADSGDWHATLAQQSQDDFFERAQKRIKFANGRTKVLRKRSAHALDDVTDASLDFVFIDADHSYEGCAADIEGWRNKVRPGGWLGGHDYRNPDFPKFGVTRAVDEFVSRHGLHLETGQNFCWFVQL